MNKKELREKYLFHIQTARKLQSIHDRTVDDNWNIFANYIQALFWRSILTMDVVRRNITEK